MSNGPTGEKPRDLAADLLARTAGRPAPKRREAGRRSRGGGQARYSGAAPDERDPVAAVDAVGGFLAERGWRQRAAVAGAVARWADVAGPEVAAHVVAEGFDEGVLRLRADSTAWATQMRLLSGTVLRKLSEAVGAGVVQRIEVRGPTPPRQRGAWRVPGRGPRDTYG